MLATFHAQWSLPWLSCHTSCQSRSLLGLFFSGTSNHEPVLCASWHGLLQEPLSDKTARETFTSKRPTGGFSSSYGNAASKPASWQPLATLKSINHYTPAVQSLQALLQCVLAATECLKLLVCWLQLPGLREDGAGPSWAGAPLQPASIDAAVRAVSEGDSWPHPC